MSAYFRGGLVVAIVLVLCGVIYSRYSAQLPVNRNPEQFSKLDAMEKDGVPAFEILKLESDAIFKSEEFKGKIVVVNFWASWCNPCVEEFPSLLRLAQKFPKDLQLIAISVDENRNDAKSFLQSLGVVSNLVSVLWDPKRLVADRYGVEKIPESFIVGRDGKLIRKVMGVDDWFTPNAIAFFEELISGKVAGSSGADTSKPTEAGNRGRREKAEEPIATH